MGLVSDRLEAFAPKTECVFQSPIEHMNADVLKPLDGISVLSQRHFILRIELLRRLTHHRHQAEQSGRQKRRLGVIGFYIRKRVFGGCTRLLIANHPIDPCIGHFDGHLICARLQRIRCIDTIGCAIP